MANHAQVQPLLGTVPFSRRIGQFLARPGMGRISVIVVLLLLWEAAGRWWLDPLFVAPPTRVIAQFGVLLSTKGLVAALYMTLVELVVAFVIGALIGISLGLLVGLQRFSRKALLPIIIFLYGIPQVTILPLILMVFGIGPPAKITFGVTHCFFPIALTVAAGVQNIDGLLLRSARSQGANRWQVFRYITFPHMLASFFSGMRLGMVGTIVGVLLAELYVSSSGVGFYSRLFSDNFQAPELFGLVFILAAMAVVLNELMRVAEVHFSRWKYLQN